MPNSIETVSCKSASELLDYLQPRHTRWLAPNAQSGEWVFRGQRDATWKLIPSAMRTNWFDEYRNSYRAELGEFVEQNPLDRLVHPRQYSVERIVTVLLQSAAEQYAANEFIELANRVGHAIPEATGFRLGSFGYSLEGVKYGYLQFAKHSNVRLPNHSIRIEYALVQHHGIPTRNLDWTHSPFVAAYFAAEEALLHQDAQEELAVWAVRFSLLDDFDTSDDNITKPSSIRIIAHRKNKVEFLKAQSGLLLCDKDADHYFLEHGEWRCFEEAIATDFPNKVILRKCTLPASEAGELLRLLSAEGVTRATLMPTLDNVTKTLEIYRKSRTLKHAGE